MTDPAARALPDPTAASPTVRRRLSIRARIGLVTTSVVLVALVVVGGGMLTAVRVGLERDLDARLRNESVLLVTRAARGADLDAVARSERLVQVVDGDGRVVQSSVGAEGLVLVAPPGPAALGPGAHTFTVADAGTDTNTDTDTDTNGASLRVRVTPLATAEPRFLVVARSLEGIDDASAALRRVLVVLVPLLTVALAGVVWLAVGRALRPIEAMRASVGDITQHDPGRRVPIPGTRDELDRLAVTLNDLLARLEASSQRGRQLVADASHELRSPLAAVRALVETRDLVSPEERAAHDAGTLAALARLQSLVDQLLELAAQDAETPRPDRPDRLVDLDDLALRQADLLRRTTTLTVDDTAVSAGQVLGQPEALTRLLENLASNAARHARSTVRFAVHEGPSGVELLVGDDGPGVAPSDRQRVFERFTRLDDARSRDDAGAGLGLAIVAGIVARNGGSVTMDDDPVLGGAAVVVTLPSPT